MIICLPSNVSDISVERYTKGEIAIIKGILTKYQNFKNKHIVVKISSNAEITRKEYQISKQLKGIPGFVRFLCLTTCSDDLNLYRNERSSICHADTDSSKPHHLLIMPYYRLGSFQAYPWQDHPVEVFKATLKQLVLSLASAFLRHGFVHVDIHMANVMLKPTKRVEIKYDDISIKTHGLKIVIIDFDKSWIGVHDNKALYFDLLRVFNEIQATMRLVFLQQAAIYTFVNECIHRMPTDVRGTVDRVLEMIDGIHEVSKYQLTQTYQYSPDV